MRSLGKKFLARCPCGREFVVRVGYDVAKGGI
jgi:hypothetical protein